ncbi:RluA family pseudouridine synthase [Clostridioides difficile]|uniref:Pseudouridine synthase n=5 Tax=Clostridioides difficile TaxID=1496 RepID=D5Q249_CLODI|nr:RluA family pseudouridine synthase [Clostridioides difficile]EFH08073.1 pseudouridine synthase, RluA family [Clostridioides difficile NAP08]EFH16490.1 pseudouridine synthase, RluA family [Clostridioides difficile NAP07]EII6765554.1 RluA family pseudouridine synthase [Clostridioides difficile]EII6785005.1 RluA family pseudouridine synthase [Clostridioides difficile]EIS9387022.1 RluA family pseudouridine synthase [Clostridioides difficile]
MFYFLKVKVGDLMYEVKEFLVLEEEEEVRLDIYLAEQLGDMSRSYIQKIIKDGKVKVNNKIEKAKYLVKEEDNIVIEIPEPKVLEVVPQDIPIDIVYEDDDVLIINKPQDMVVHPAPGNYENTLVNGILYHCKDKLSSINGVIRPGIVHRIDKDTSGLLMIAKNNYAHNFLAEQLKEHTITREYEFICYGVVKENKITVDKPIGRNPKDRLKMAVVKDGKNAITHFEVVERFDKFTHMRAKLETGRTHQIRVHALSINHPLLGDYVYGPKETKFKLKGQTLHAKKLGFIHPTTKEYIEFNSELPEYFKEVIKKIK